MLPPPPNLFAEKALLAKTQDSSRVRLGLNDATRWWEDARGPVFPRTGVSWPKLDLSFPALKEDNGGVNKKVIPILWLRVPFR